MNRAERFELLLCFLAVLAAIVWDASRGFVGLAPIFSIGGS